MASIRKRSWTTKDGQTHTAFFVDLYDANGVRSRRQFASRADANDFRIDMESRIRAGTYRHEGAKVTVKRLAELFLEHCKARMERHERMTRHTYEVYEGHVWNYICPDPRRFEGKHRPKQLRSFSKGIGEITLGKLTARQIGEFRDRLRETGLSAVTIRKIIGTLRVMLAHAIELNYIAVNAARGVKVIGRRDEGARRIEPPTKEALRQLLDVADADFRVVLMFAAATGLRAGEQHALRWKHLDLERGEVKVEARVDAYRQEDITKTKAGMRMVPLSRALVLALKEWRLRTTFKKPQDLVFPNRWGRFHSHTSLLERKYVPLFAKLAKRHADEPGQHPEPPAYFNWHALRHFAISCWIEAGLAPKTVQTFAGHSTLAVTMDRYGHLFKSDDHRRAMDDIAGEVFK